MPAGQTGNWRDKNPGVVYFTELGTLLEVIVEIWSLYEKYFQKMPEGFQGKDGLESAHNMLKFYADVRELVRLIFQDRQQLNENIRFLQEKIDYMQFDKTFMVLFFGFKAKYEATMR